MTSLTPSSAVKPPARSLTLLPARIALYRLLPSDSVPGWTALARSFVTISRTPTELSIVIDEDALPPELDAERGYRALRVEGPLPFEMAGVIAAIAVPLAAVSVPIFPIATFDTDYVLVHETALARAIVALRTAGHVVVEATIDVNVRQGALNPGLFQTVTSWTSSTPS